jgi:hypothetical protein
MEFEIPVLHYAIVFPLRAFAGDKKPVTVKSGLYCFKVRRCEDFDVSGLGSV